MEIFEIEATRPAHDALGDAYHTALICARLDLEKGAAEYDTALKEHVNGFHGAEIPGCISRKVFYDYADKKFITAEKTNEGVLWIKSLNKNDRKSVRKKIFAAEKKKRNVPMDQITEENVRKSVRKKKIFGVEITKRSDPMDQISEEKRQKDIFLSIQGA